MTTQGNGNVWRYEDATGVERIGEMITWTTSGQGSDLTYSFRRLDSGKLDLVSGMRLKRATRLYGIIRDFESESEVYGPQSASLAMREWREVS
jgi:hypothetical protein